MNIAIKSLAFCALVGAVQSANAITVGVDSTKTWLGFMNVSNLPANGGVYQFGGTWGTGDLVAYFTGPVLTLAPNTIGDVNEYWYQNTTGLATPPNYGGPGQAGNKIMAASMYVETNDGSLSGQTVTFTGQVVSNTFTSAHSTVAFIKDFDGGYGLTQDRVITVPVTNGVFSITLNTLAGAGRHVQYGFETTGVNVWVTDVAPFGKLEVGPVPPPPFAATIETGTLLSWTASAANSYQPQLSTDGIGWTDLGAPLSGNTVSSLFETVPAPFYQVLETTPDLFSNLVSNPGFETTAPASPANPGAAGWDIVVAANAGASMEVVTSYAAISPHQGSQMLKLESTGPGAPAPNTDVRSGFIPVTENTDYDFSFYAANPVKTGGGNPQFTIFYYDGANAPLGNSFTSFAAVGSAWTKVSKIFTTPAGTASLTVGWTGGAGADPGVHWVTLLDDALLSNGIPSTPGFTAVIPSTVAPGARISWPTQSGRSYQVKSTTDLVNWTNFGGSTTGSGAVSSVTDLITPPSKFYRVFETTP
ncbi:MAG: hypothetical protein V4819_22310 [Verrucomicrobiota bacterium]